MSYRTLKVFVGCNGSFEPPSASDNCIAPPHVGLCIRDQYGVLGHVSDLSIWNAGIRREPLSYLYTETWIVSPQQGVLSSIVGRVGDSQGAVMTKGI